MDAVAIEHPLPAPLPLAARYRRDAVRVHLGTAATALGVAGVFGGALAGIGDRRGAPVPLRVQVIVAGGIFGGSTLAISGQALAYYGAWHGARLVRRLDGKPAIGLTAVGLGLYATAIVGGFAADSGSLAALALAGPLMPYAQLAASSVARRNTSLARPHYAWTVVPSPHGAAVVGRF